MSIAKEAAQSSGRWSWLLYVGAGRSVGAAAQSEEARRCWQPIGAVCALWPAGAASPSGRLPCRLPPGFVRIECNQNPVLGPCSPCLQSLSSFTVLRKVLLSLSVPLARFSSLSSPDPNPAQSVSDVEGPRPPQTTPRPPAGQAKRGWGSPTAVCRTVHAKHRWNRAEGAGQL